MLWTKSALSVFYDHEYNLWCALERDNKSTFMVLSCLIYHPLS